MEDMLSFLLIMVAVVSVLSKKKEKKAGKGKSAAGTEPLEKQLKEWLGVEETQPAPSPMAEKTHEGIHPCEEHQPQPMQPAPVPEVLGSLGEDTHEGIHPCENHNAAPLTEDVPILEEEAPPSGLTLEWTGENLVKSFIMQEVLTRPAQRRRT